MVNDTSHDDDTKASRTETADTLAVTDSDLVGEKTNRTVSILSLIPPGSEAVPRGTVTTNDVVVGCLQTQKGKENKSHMSLCPFIITRAAHPCISWPRQRWRRDYLYIIFIAPFTLPPLPKPIAM
jgi:hypothetical protein